ncbi:hypothetical protein [Paenibacillus sp. IHBB 3054]|uniref:hypothetical protein n=1 Tax=Paenibacillus sp. IHBB 3054 TaxID=3425689 RepID=UPI003F6666EC
MVHFFRSSAWSLDALRTVWLLVVQAHAPLLYPNGKVVLMGDGCIQGKEANRMPGVKKLHQELENSANGAYFFGHCFGRHPPSVGHVPEMVLPTPDRSGFAAVEQWNQSGSTWMDLVTKAKSNTVAYERPGTPATGRDRPRKKGTKVVLAEMFQSRAATLQYATMSVYGKEEAVSYLCLDLLWGQRIYQELRFVLVKLNGRCSILASIDLTLEATEIIEVYTARFKIECTFRALKQSIGGFSYHFCSKPMPKLNRYLKKG